MVQLLGHASLIGLAKRDDAGPALITLLATMFREQQIERDATVAAKCEQLPGTRPTFLDQAIRITPNTEQVVCAIDKCRDV